MCRSSLAVKVIDGIQMAVASFPISIDSAQIARTVIVTDKIILVATKIRTKDVVKGIWSTSPSCARVCAVFDSIGKWLS